jgi:transposase
MVTSMIAGVRDARRLSPEGQEDLRRRVVAAVAGGMTQAEAARVFVVAPQSVSRWMAAWRRRGSKGLAGRRRGRKQGEQKALSARQQRKLRYAVCEHTPATFGLDGLVWTRKAVAELIEARHGLRLSLTTVGKYLRSWGLSPQKPIRRAYEQDPQKVAQWLEQDYPAIAARARTEDAVVLWLDQTGIRSDAATARTWAPKGQTPVVGKTGKRFSVNAMCAISNTGQLYFTVYTGSFNASVFIPFLDRLVTHLDRKVHLIVDGHPVHRRKSVAQWVADHGEAIEMHFLPGYSPELNPDEILNADLKRAVAATTAPKTITELERAIRSVLHRRQKQPNRIRSYFGKPEVRYAA